MTTYTAIHENLFFEEHERRFDVRLKDLLAEYQSEDPHHRDSTKIRDHFEHYKIFLEDEPGALNLPYRYRDLPVAVIDEETRMGDIAPVVARFATPREAGEWMAEHLDSDELGRGRYGIDVDPDGLYPSSDDPTKACGYCGRDNEHGTHGALTLTGHLSHEWDPNAEPGPEHPDYKAPAKKPTKKTTAKKTAPKPEGDS